MCLVNDQAQRLRQLAEQADVALPVRQAVPSNKIPRSFAITSGKGGVGKTNIALFLATSFAKAKKRVLVLDADLGLANIHILLGIAPAHTIAHFLEGTCKLSQVIISTPDGFDIVPGASGIEKLADIDTGRLLLLEQEFFKLESQYDILIVDTGAGIGSTVTRFASSADSVVVVMTPEPTSFADAYAMIKVLNERTTATVSIVVNMASSEKEGIETFDKLNALVVKFLKRTVDFLGVLPFTDEVGFHVRKQRLLLSEKSESAFSRRVYAIARKLYGDMNSIRKLGFFGRMLDQMKTAEK